jgi:hypothetical protein
MIGWSKNERAFPVGLGQVAQALRVQDEMIFPEEARPAAPSHPKPPPVVNRQPSRTGTAPPNPNKSPTGTGQPWIVGHAKVGRPGGVLLNDQGLENDYNWTPRKSPGQSQTHPRPGK